MATKKTTKGPTKKEARQSTANKNGRKAESSSGSSFFTWFMVLALLGVWTSVAVVWFELVDYDDVLARAKEFRYNISEVLQGKLRAYDADGDGDFDVEDAKVLLGLAEGPAAMRNKASLDPRKPVVKEPVSEAEVESGTEPVVENEVAKGSAHEASRAPRDSSAEALEEATAEEEDEELAQVEEEEEGEATAGEEEPVLEEEELLAEEEEPETVGEEEEEEEEEAAPSEALPASVEEALETELEVEEEPEEEAGGSEAGEAVPVTEEAEEHLRNEEDADIQDTVDVTEDVSDVRGSQNVDVESEIQAPVPLPEVEESAVGSDPEEDLTEDTIDTEGELVEDLEPEKTVDGTSSDAEEADGPAEEEPREELADEEPDLVEDPPQAESSAEALETEGQHQEEPSEKPESQQEEKPKVKAKKKKPKLLNKFDRTIKTEIDAAEKLRKMGKLEEAARAFEALVQKYPQSPRSHYGKAQSEDDLAEKMRSNEILQRAISSYGEAAGLPDAPSDLVRAALKRRAERQQFLGRMRGALLTLERLVQMFPADISLKNDLGVGYLLMGDNKSAKKVYEEVLAAIPDDGFAKVHYGFILKSENKIAESIPFLREGLESGDQGTDDGRFYFHLGDALQRVGDSSAYKWYELGYQRGHFASVWQRSLYNVKGLRAQPWWTARETGYMDMVKALERNWRMIRDEALSVMDTTMGLFVPEDENLREKGEWGQFTLWQQGRKVEKSCQSVPKTCALMERYPEAIGCKRGQVKYSVMQPGTHVWPHTGPTNCRLRMHLGLVIPTQGCRIRCTNETREWEEGKVLIFDDSFEHEVWQEADRYRLIFIVDVWHPELTQYQRQTLSPI